MQKPWKTLPLSSMMKRVTRSTQGISTVQFTYGLGVISAGLFCENSANTKAFSGHVMFWLMVSVYFIYNSHVLFSTVHLHFNCLKFTCLILERNSIIHPKQRVTGTSSAIYYTDFIRFSSCVLGAIALWHPSTTQPPNGEEFKIIL